MNIIFEGLDNTGKDTQIKLIHKYLIDKPTHVLHYSAIKNISSQQSRKYCEKLYVDVFKLMNDSINKRHLIFNRSWLGEYVYSPLYRNYSGEYVFKIEERFKDTYYFERINLIIFIDTAENLITRDDGQSHSIDVEMKNKEIKMFREVYYKTNIQNKIIININNKSIEDVHIEIKNFLKLKDIINDK